MENQKPITSFEHYSVDRSGFVVNTKTGRVLKADIVSKGYELVTLSNKSKVKREYIHRLVGQKPANLKRLP